MLYTAQRMAANSNWAAPAGDSGESLYHCNNRSDVNESLEEWGDMVALYDNREDAYLMVWCREHLEDVTDLYPDFRVSYGPRGGIRWETV